MTDTDKNNGGQTDYYALPLPKRQLVDQVLFKVLKRNISVNDGVNEILALCPQTLNDIMEFKKVRPWQHEVIKAAYAIEGRAEKNGGSELRELNKIIYYAERRKAELEGRPWE